MFFADGDRHFVFDDPAAFDFPGDFTVSLMVRPPPNLEPFHMLLSRRRASDYLQHHQIFVDTRSTWVSSQPQPPLLCIALKRMPFRRLATGS